VTGEQIIKNWANALITEEDIMLSRRGFLNATIGASAALTIQDPRRASAQVDRRLIVDAQVHLWKAESDDWKWVPGLVPQLPEPFTIERLVPLMDEAGVDRVVIVPPSWPGDRNDYALEAVRRYPTRFRIMGKIPLQDPKSADRLPTWKEQTGMAGLRVIFNTAQTVPWLTDGTADWLWAAAEKAGLPVMCFAPGRTSAFGRVAERYPQLNLILDHMNVTAAMARDNTLTQAIGETVALAGHPNVSVKVSATPGLSREPYPWRDARGHIKRVFDAYGPQRCYWGTDMTNSYAKASYRQRITQFTEELSFLSESDKDWVMGRGILQRLKWT
jgi:predicted TIM-barrel fold metal-dependent hydrolase